MSATDSTALQDETLPEPIRKTLLAIASEPEPGLRLQQLCLSLIPMTFQYLALVLSGEYLQAEAPPDADTTDTLTVMVRRPGPGKWVGFIRSAAVYFGDHPTMVLPREAIEAIAETLVAKDRSRIPLASGRRLDAWEALVHLRNRFAHSRHIDRDTSAALMEEHLPIWKDLMTRLAPVFEARVLVASEDNGVYRPLDGGAFKPSVITPKRIGQPLILWNEATGAWLRLFPLVIPYHETEITEALLLEEIKGKQLLYLRGDELVKRKEEFRELVQMLGTRTPEERRLSSEELSSELLGARVDRVTKRTLADFEDTLKYIPGIFVPRGVVTAELDKWLEGDLPGCIVVGEPGVGKTSLVADWTIQRREAGDHVLLLEAAKLEDPDLPRKLEEVLGLRSPLKSCLEAVTTGDSERHFVVIIDAVNEFVGKGLGGRSVLWREINSLVERFDDFRPHIRCLVTTRSDVWKTDFQQTDAVDRVLKRRLFDGNEDFGFPVLVIGEFSPEEAERAYGRARAEIPGMSPETSWAELPEPVREMASNPFSMRILLQTYSGQPVPRVTKRKLLRTYAQEKAMAEKERKEVLFHLLTRLSELRKTEVTLEEFLYDGPKRKKQRSKGAGYVDLESIVFDPRSGAPYRSLVDEGLIEERTVGTGQKSEERLAFAQEKVLHLLDEEFRREKLRGARRAALILGLAFLTSTVGLSIFVFSKSRRFVGELHEMVAASSLSADNAAFVDDLFVAVMTGPMTRTLLVFGLATLFIIAIALLSGFLEILQRRLGDRFFPADFSTRALRDRMQDRVQRSAGMAILVLLVVTASALPIRHILGYPGLDISVFVRWTLIVAVVAGVLVLLVAARMVAREATTPEAAYVLFGWRPVGHWAVGALLGLPVYLVLTIGLLYLMPQFFDISNSAPVLELERQLEPHGVLQQLESSSEAADWEVYTEAVDLLRSNREYADLVHGHTVSVMRSVLAGLLVAALVLLPLFAIAWGLTGGLLERFLARKSASPSSG
jgi:hypothetical protein